jgi:hypothetical protein
MIINCPQCKPNEFQDKTYGKNKRVGNKTADPGQVFKCTVCGNKVTLSK